MSVCIHCAKCVGIIAKHVTVEINICSGVGIYLVGMADMAVRESLLRITTALQSLNYNIPGRKIVVNLAPADLHKHGSGYDLPIAIGILAASGQVSVDMLDKCMFMGELGLDGAIRGIKGVLPTIELAEKMELKYCIFPRKSAIQASGFSKIKTFGVDNLNDVVSILNHNVNNLNHKKSSSKEYLLTKPLSKDTSAKPSSVKPSSAKPLSKEYTSAKPSRGAVNYMDFSEIIGQEEAKRGLEIAAAGGHNVIMIGPPGSGKTSLARSLITIMPKMTKEEAIETSKIYSVAGIGDFSHGLIRERPFRMPHYNATVPALIGGGSSDNIYPGEVSLAQNGVLFLDEFCEIKKDVLEALRSPIEDNEVVISRLKTKVSFPASFMLIAATNPCPCGYYGEDNKCLCTVSKRLSYFSRLSGPIMDRIDIQLWLHPIKVHNLIHKPKEESSAKIAKRVAKARKIQNKRFKEEGIFVNAQMDNRLIERYCKLDESTKAFLAKAVKLAGYSARSFYRILKISRTIADLDNKIDISEIHIAEALRLRFLDKPNILK